jgi:hypothetical protein
MSTQGDSRRVRSSRPRRVHVADQFDIRRGLARLIGPPSKPFAGRWEGEAAIARFRGAHGQVHPPVKALRESGNEAAAIHDHMLDDEESDLPENTTATIPSENFHNRVTG